MKTLERYEEICMNYFNGNISDFKKDLKRLTKKELLNMVYQLGVRLGGLEDPPDFRQANDILHRHL